MKFGNGVVRSLVLATMLTAATVARAADQAPTPVRILMDWFAQANQAGFWQAQLSQTGKSGGVQITVMQGGPRIQTIPQVASGQAEFGLGNADDVLLARHRGVPIRAVYAALEYVPYSLVYHSESGINGVKDLNGHTVALSLGAAYWEWTKKQYGLQAVREIPVTGDLSIFRADPSMVQQGYSIFLPARMQEAGIKVGQIRIASLGYRPYSVLFTTDEMIAKHRQLVKATVEAVRKGWAGFAEHPEATQPMMLEANKQITPAVHAAAVNEMLSDLLPKDRSRLGCMTDARWSELAGQLRSVSLLPSAFSERDGYDLSLLSGC